jgi:hypothetical protein
VRGGDIADTPLRVKPCPSGREYARKARP